MVIVVEVMVDAFNVEKLKVDIAKVAGVVVVVELLRILAAGEQKRELLCYCVVIWRTK